MSDPKPANSNPSTSSKADRKEYYSRRDATKVYLLQNFTRWREFMAKKNVKTDAQVAEILLDFYDSTIFSRVMCHVETQTDQTMELLSEKSSTPQSSSMFILPSPIAISMPGPSASRHTRRRLLQGDTEMSPIPKSSSPRYLHSLGEETFTASEGQDSDTDDNDDDDDVDRTLTANTLSPVTERSTAPGPDKSFMEEDDTFNVTISGHDGEELDDEIEEGGTTGYPPSGYTSTLEVVTPEEAIKMEKCIVFTDTLMSLIKSLHGRVCKRQDCGLPLEYRKTYLGTCLVVSWRCNAGHVGGRWAAQPSCDKIRAGNLMLASALLLSGNLFAKVGLMFNFCNLQYFSSTLFNQYQQLYIIPTINEFWEQHKQQLWSEKAGKEVVLSGDGRNDSPGHSAQYCTYSLADMEDRAILEMNVVDVREAGGKSNNMERIGFERGMDKLLTTPMVVKEVVTDGHLEIAALMKRENKYTNVKHQNDVWHGRKSIAKKINAAAKSKANEDLAFWAPSIRNHFWHCSKTCGNDSKNLKDKWISILHHVVDEHEWVLEEGINAGKCGHDPLNDEERKKPWLKKESSAHKALTKIVMDTRFLNTLGYYTNFRHTGFLESFHNVILMYASKRQAFSFVVYRARNQLAALDFNHHRGRAPATTADGHPRFGRRFNKRTQRWCHVRVLVPKQYTYIPQLLLKVFEKRVSSVGTVDCRIGMVSEDPRRIAPNIAAIPPPSVKSLVESHESRFH